MTPLAFGLVGGGAALAGSAIAKNLKKAKKKHPLGGKVGLFPGAALGASGLAAGLTARRAARKLPTGGEEVITLNPDAGE